MTPKQFTAFVVAICMTVLAVLCAVAVVSLSVWTFDSFFEIPDDGPNGSIGAAFGIMAYSLMWAIVTPICAVGAAVFSGIGIVTAIAAINTPTQGVRVTSIILLCINGVIFAVPVLLLIVAFIA
ncbi:MAG: hypothetical protein IJY27_03190 [Clostridia bacterium]|nr:hypothetical protein [Clostridia bacterium]